MLSFEWQELEVLLDRLNLLGDRYAAAQRSHHTGHAAGLKKEIARTRRQRDLLVQHISARFGAVVAERNHRPETADRCSPDASIAESECEPPA